ncbi:MULTISPECIES: DUF2789 domain-containing protein [Deefgea]|uniref:DUF2789 family protein n=1 Tax=Deefgea chitinilytica TaxID=570276 RepID=A0ABS2C8A6_9NEIS|nr:MULTISPECIES: DUF2789 domain-containing protein [Deefgea]MBM5570392.1 DUF2789 family protein [Deefgea chitinilytica]MBM9887621.1 DUF2789 domain-containing protein [Deefgea sp. CFH1-16]
MDTSPHSLCTLFAQLGLASDAASIKRFICSHRLSSDINIAAAPFWTPSQAAFLADELQNDAEWAEMIDELAVLLSHN